MKILMAFSDMVHAYSHMIGIHGVSKLSTCICSVRYSSVNNSVSTIHFLYDTIHIFMLIVTWRSCAVQLPCTIACMRADGAEASIVWPVLRGPLMIYENAGMRQITTKIAARSTLSRQLGFARRFMAEFDTVDR